MHYFCNRFSKVAKRRGFPPQRPLSIDVMLVVWSCVIWLNCDFFSNWLRRNRT